MLTVCEIDIKQFTNILPPDVTTENTSKSHSFLTKKSIITQQFQTDLISMWFYLNGGGLKIYSIVQTP